MSIAVLAVQLTTIDAIEVTWTTTDPDPVAGWHVERDVDSSGFDPAGVILDPAFRRWLDINPPDVGSVVAYRIIDQDTLTAGDSDSIVIADTEADYTFGPVDPLVSTIRYTTLDAVKARMGVKNSESDTELTAAIIAAEVAIDQVNGRSLPDTGVNPEIPGIPEAIRTWALDASIAVWKAADAPFGQGGGDAWLGALDVAAITERVLRRHPLALGYKVSWGVG